MFECERLILPNGLRIIITPMSNSSTITSMVMVLGGSRFESKEKRGISHFMEHMFFKGGVKYPTAFDLAKLVDAVGGRRNASTGKEDVMYFVKHGASCGNLGLDILADMIIGGSFPEEELRKEQKVVLEEFNMRKDDPEVNLFDSFPEYLIYGDHPLGNSPIGTRETIQKITRNDLFEYRNTFYKPNNMVISVAGNINAQNFLQEIQDRFGRMTPGPVPEWRLFDGIRIKNNRVFTLPRKEMEQAVMILAVHGMGYQHRDYLPLHVLISLLGSGESSRLFQEIREKKGLVYGIYSGGEMYKESGLVLSQWETSNENIEKSLRVVIDEYEKIKQYGIEEEGLKRVKGMIIGSKEMSCENNGYLAREYGQDELMLGRVITFDEFCKIINEVTQDDVLRLARTYLKTEKLKVAMAAEEKYCDKEKLEKILENAQ